MTLRRDHSDAEVQELAARFRQTWSPGEVVKSWLRRHAIELQRLVQEEGWAWANIGRALGLANIVYKTGNPWTGENLRRAVTIARKPTKLELRRARAAQTGAETRPITESAAASASGASPSGDSDGGEFRIVRRRALPTTAANPGETSSSATGQSNKEVTHD